MRMRKAGLGAAVAAWAVVLAGAAAAQHFPAGMSAHFTPANRRFDHVRRVVDIPMRDGAKFPTAIVMEKGTHDAPVPLERTRYDAAGAVRGDVPFAGMAVRASDALFLDRGDIRVYQGVRGQYGSGGDYMNERPLRGPGDPMATVSVFHDPAHASAIELPVVPAVS